MKVLLLVLAIALPVSFAKAKSITINVVDELTYKEIIAYKDGTKEIRNPKAYGYFFKGAYRGEAEDNALAICFMMGLSKAIHYNSVLTGQGGLTTVLYKVENGILSEPKFGYGGEIETVVLGKVLCR